MSEHIIFLVLRRMRRPLIALIIVYAIATLGLTLIPGVDPDGNPWRMSIFHAFYFVSFMGSTIGFGEIPYPFTDPQRYWVLGCIYVSVIAWLYAIGTMLSLIQDPSFKQAVTAQQFSRSIARIDTPFYIICGYGDTARILTTELTLLGFTVVVLDKDPDSLSDIDLGDFHAPVLDLTADITVPENLQNAGINNPHCQAIIALTSHDHTNLKVAVSSKALRPELLTVCRAELAEEIANLQSFNTDVIVNPYDIFSDRLISAMRNPVGEAIAQWLISQQQAELPENEERQDAVPTDGLWIICGYGKLGRTIKEYMDSHQVDCVVIEQSIKDDDLPANCIEGTGTEAGTLEQAGIHKAKGLIAGTNDDANNLSILLTAKQLNSQLFTVGRLNEAHNLPLYSSAKPDIVLRNSQLMADAILTRLTRPLVTRFLREMPKLSPQRTNTLYHSISALTGGETPVTWRITLTDELSPAASEMLANGKTIELRQLLPNRAICLLIKRAGRYELMPDREMPLHVNDELLICGLRKGARYTEWLTRDIEILDSRLKGSKHHIPLLRWIERQKTNKHPTLPGN